MNGSLKIGKALVLLVFAGFAFSSCGGASSGFGSATASGTQGVASGTPGTSDTTTGTSSATVETVPVGYESMTSNLFVSMANSMPYTNYSSLLSNWGTKCFFTNGAVVNDITCVEEGNELAVLFNGAKFYFNVPAGACKYTSMYPYWYYNYETGYGPTEVSLEVTQDGSGAVTSFRCDTNGNGLSSPHCTSDSDVSFVNDGSDVNVVCNYDTSAQTGGQDCCFGKYNLTKTTITPSGQTTTAQTGVDWGGSVQNCIGGAGKTDWTFISKDGFPVPLIQRMDPASSTALFMSVKGALTTLGSKTNIPVANFYSQDGRHTHTGYGPAAGTTSPYPYFVDPVSDRGGTLMYPGNPYYLFDCLDEAFETNYRFRLFVREWNTVAALTTYISTGTSSPTSNPDVSGTAPVDCPGLAGQSCNNVGDIDDFLTNLGGTYNTAVPANRTNFFPKDQY